MYLTFKNHIHNFQILIISSRIGIEKERLELGWVSDSQKGIFDETSETIRNMFLTSEIVRNCQYLIALIYLYMLLHY